MRHNLKYYSELAHDILNSETQYLSNKKIILALFNDNNINDFESIVKNRITIIDSYYSTQMSKRLYGIDELSSILAKYPDATLKADTGKFLKNPNEDSIIAKLFSSKYGIDKSGKPFGKSISLISKYLYFLNNFKFPIYDSLALLSYKLLQQNSIVTPSQNISEKNYFNLIKELNNVSNIKNYEKLDNLLWLVGKLSKGSFSILMGKEKYLRIIGTKEVKLVLKKPENKKSSAKDEVIRNYIKENYKTSNLFPDNQKTFFEFVFDLKNQ